MSDRKLSGTTQKKPVSIAHATRIIDTAPLRLRQCRQMRARNSRTVSAVPSILIAGRIEVRGTRDQHTIRRVAILRKVLAAVLIAGATISLPAQGTSKWVSLGKNRRLHYTADARGNRIIDFSHAGYKGGGVALPNVPVARRLQPSGGDDTAQIQAAIDEVSRLPQNAQGHRGAVQLALALTRRRALKISASGVCCAASLRRGCTTVSVTAAAPFLETPVRSCIPMRRAATGRLRPAGADSSPWIPPRFQTVDAPDSNGPFRSRDYLHAWNVLARDGNPVDHTRDRASGSTIQVSAGGSRATARSAGIERGALNPRGVHVKYTFGRIAQSLDRCAHVPPATWRLPNAYSCCEFRGQ